MKDKTKNKTTMSEFSRDLPTKSGESKKVEETKDFEDFRYDKEFLDSLKDYNSKVQDLDKDYTKLNPRTGIIVRVFLKEPKVKGDIIVPFKQNVMVPTSNGVGTVGTIESPYPYSKKAVVISCPDIIKDIKEGDLVQLTEEAIKSVALGGGKSAQIMLPNWFASWEYEKDIPPTDPKNKHYGYLKLNSKDIDCVL